jgi:ABC-2 type transport system permease protein
MNRAMGTGTLTPRPGSASTARMLAAQTLLETRLLLRNGEQLLLTLVIPSLLLVIFSAVPVVDYGGAGEPVNFVTPGVIALAVVSTAFTGQAIATGFERRYGVLKRLGASPLPRWVLLAAKTATVAVVELVQVALLVVIALALGWSPHGSPLAVLALLVAGTAAFSGLGLLMAGTLRAEATLAAANLVFLLLLFAGGVVIPLDRFPEGVRDLAELLPVTALADGLRAVLQDGAALPWGEVGLLAAWAVAALGAAALTFRWE